MSGVDHRVESLLWPSEWRRDEKRERDYRARSSDGVQVVWVDYDGVGEQGLLVSAKQPGKGEAILFTVLGGLLTAAVIAGVALIVVYREWTTIGGVLCLGLFAIPMLLLGIHNWRNADSKHRPGLRLTPTRVVYGAADGNHITMGWEDIARIRPFVNVVGKRRWWNAFSLEVHDPEAVLSRFAPRNRRLHRRIHGTAVVTLNDNQVAVHPLLAYHLVRYYYENPADRPDITQARV
ncbi:hypothetical protein [Nocardia goodfellowii]|uniref:Uncharacterized protein n=1 Tax=Nocardia goodfellowii TaxID=882446 RepID=A0ABS4QAT8_9NOCA|nr:hypothetical protein [Nocardia goodfellowii]MBP2188807.1 hypothetical protein [Nocardia goodfellowii]